MAQLWGDFRPRGRFKFQGFKQGYGRPETFDYGPSPRRMKQAAMVQRARGPLRGTWHIPEGQKQATPSHQAKYRKHFGGAPYHRYFKDNPFY